MSPLLGGFVCAFHPATLGSSPKHTIYAFIIINQNLELNENKQIEDEFCHLKSIGIDIDWPSGLLRRKPQRHLAFLNFNTK